MLHKKEVTIVAKLNFHFCSQWIRRVLQTCSSVLICDSYIWYRVSLYVIQSMHVCLFLFNKWRDWFLAVKLSDPPPILSLHPHLKLCRMLEWVPQGANWFRCQLPLDPQSSSFHGLCEWKWVASLTLIYYCIITGLDAEIKICFADKSADLYLKKRSQISRVQYLFK